MDVSHGFHVFRDGDAWCAVGPHFIDLMKSTAGFGNTPASGRTTDWKSISRALSRATEQIPKLSKLVTLAEAERQQ